jgi:hypothetical protein
VTLGAVALEELTVFFWNDRFVRWKGRCGSQEKGSKPRKTVHRRRHLEWIA